MVDVDDKNEWKECIDIGGVRLPTGYFFGASAATGDLSGRSQLSSGVFLLECYDVLLNHLGFILIILLHCKVFFTLKF